MKLVLSISLLFLLNSGCVALGLKKSESEKRSVLFAGNSQTEVTKMWGECDRVEFRDGANVCWYENSGEPMYFYYDANNNLRSWEYDQQGAIEMRQARQQRAAAFANAFSSSSESTPQTSYRPQMQTTFQSTPAKQVDYNCVNQCQRAGYQYGLCQSKCSY